MDKAIIFFISFFSLLSHNGSWSNENSLHVTKHSKETQKIRENLIARAQNIILFSPNYAGGKLFQKTFRAMGQRLEDAQDLIIFSLISDDFIQEEDRTLLHELKKAFDGRFFYVLGSRKIKFDIKNGLFSEENHAKIFIADDIAVVGGTGLSENMCTDGLPIDPEFSINKKPFCLLAGLVAENLRDMDVVVRGPGVNDIKHIFYRLYKKWFSYEQDNKNTFKILKVNLESKNNIDTDNFIKPDKFFNNISIKVLGDLKYDEDEKNTYEISNTIISLINNAHTNIILAQMTFYPIYPIENCLRKKIEENPNIDVTLISNCTFTNMSPAAKTFIELNKKNYKFIKNVYGYAVANTLYHKKVIVFDDRYSIIGSYNFSKKSGRYDDEIAILIDSYEVAKKINGILEIDKLLSKKIINKRRQFKNIIINGMENLIVKKFV